MLKLSKYIFILFVHISLYDAGQVIYFYYNLEYLPKTDCLQPLFKLIMNMGAGNNIPIPPTASGKIGCQALGNPCDNSDTNHTTPTGSKQTDQPIATCVTTNKSYRNLRHMAYHST